MQMGLDYIEYRPYRKKREFYNWIVELMDEFSSDGFENYWEQFGYEIGGPVCYSFTRWIVEVLNDNSNINDVVFIARDGWIIKNVYEMLTRGCQCRSHYVYANRALQNNKDELWVDDYHHYIKEKSFFGDTIACVDSISTTFTAQRLLSKYSEKNILGLYWVVNSWRKNRIHDLAYYTYQKENYNILYNWNIMEFIMSSPELPIMDIKNGIPIYSKGNSFEQTRRVLYKSIEKGINKFILRECDKYKDPPYVDEITIRYWINDFLLNPNEEDKKAFESVVFSTNVDHSDETKMDPFNKKDILLERTKILLKKAVTGTNRTGIIINCICKE